MGGIPSPRGTSSERNVLEELSRLNIQGIGMEKCLGRKCLVECSVENIRVETSRGNAGCRFKVKQYALEIYSTARYGKNLRNYTKVEIYIQAYAKEVSTRKYG